MNYALIVGLSSLALAGLVGWDNRNVVPETPAAFNAGGQLLAFIMLGFFWTAIGLVGPS